MMFGQRGGGFNPTWMRAQALRAPAPPAGGMAQPGGGLPGMGGMMGQMPMPQGPVAQSQSLPPPPQMPMPRQPLPGPMGPIGQSNSAMPNPPSPVSGMMGGMFPRQLPGPIAQSSQNLWAGPQSY